MTVLTLNILYYVFKLLPNRKRIKDDMVADRLMVKIAGLCAVGELLY